jgi:hypothetical protein
MPPRYTYDQFVILPLTKGYIVFNLTINRMNPVPGLVDGDVQWSSESDKEVSIQVELPGIEEKDIEVFLTGDSLTIKGEKKEEKEKKPSPTTETPVEDANAT